MSFKMGKGRQFFKLKVEEQVPNDPRLLQVMLFQSEQCWAYAMDLRQILSNNSSASERIKAHIKQKLKRAHKWALKLDQLCRERSTQSTAQESKAYSNFMEGLVHHEYKRFQFALRSYITSRQIYVELMKVSDTLKSVLYKEKIEQLDQSIRYCYQKTNESMFDSIEKILEKYKSETKLGELNANH